MEVSRSGFCISNSDYLGNIVKSPEYIAHNKVPETVFNFKVFVRTGLPF